MLYCRENDTFSMLWTDHGVSNCFYETVSNAVLLFYIVIFGQVEIRKYRNAIPLDHRAFPFDFRHKLHISLHLLLPLSAILRVVLQDELLYDKVLYGYMIAGCGMYCVSFGTAGHILYLGKYRAIPNVARGGHGIILLGFWTLNLVIEFLSTMNYGSKNWYFKLESKSDWIEIYFFAFRCGGGLVIWFLGMLGPGIPESYYQLRQRLLHGTEDTPEQSSSEQSSIEQSRNRSAFAGFATKCRKLIPFLWPKKSFRLQLRVILCFLFLIFGRVINVFVPMYNKFIVDSLSGRTEPIVFRWDYVLIYVSFWFLQGQGSNSFLNNIRSFLWIRVQQYTVKEIELEMYHHLHSLSLQWHLGRKIGEVLRVMDRGTNSISSLLSYIIFNIIPTFADIFIAVIYFGVAFNIWFGLIVLATMVLYLVSTIMLTEWRTKFRRDANKLENEVEAQCVDSLLNFETVKYYDAEDYELRNLEGAVDNFQVAEWKSTASLNLMNTFQNSTISLGVLGGALLCVHYVVQGQLTAGDYVLFSTYILQLYTPLNFFGTYYRMVQTAFVDMENMFTLFDTKPDIIDSPDAVTLKSRKGNIEFRNVSFSYVPERKIIKNISFEVPAGKTVALVGPTGSGKSTITRLLFRFYDVASGEILIDRQNIAKVQMRSLRQAIGVVPQDTVLFNKSIRYNIAYGRPSASDFDLTNAAKVAEIHDQILTFPEGYETIVGERGLKLSGGEKQRVAIARTILKDPLYVVLDEATSSLDTQTERNIQQSLNAMCKDRTTLVVAHRLSTIINADQILVLKDGEIIERGSHSDLLEHNGLYASMWQQQQEPENKEMDEKIIDI